MTTFNKLNQNQKNILGEYMKEHPNLAKNMIPNCAQGKATSIRLYEDLSRKLNAVGLPVKDAKRGKKCMLIRNIRWTAIRGEVHHRGGRKYYSGKRLRSDSRWHGHFRKFFVNAARGVKFSKKFGERTR
ncbi:uncharacterized protein LOC118739829 [Rhagoletis pomonella]|uniref:uncharacterized protein LOC118739829 n=1 Tax=Rhagoletis pomonella TaxID=28610 RepID=UPI001784BBA1|nr:uncharacterized protein LOC118739829 [Rhagoletis pomonella]